jgi:hypothetical protein
MGSMTVTEVSLRLHAVEHDPFLDSIGDTTPPVTRAVDADERAKVIALEVPRSSARTASRRAS